MLLFPYVKEANLTQTMNRRTFLSAAAFLPWSPSVMSCCNPLRSGLPSAGGPGTVYLLGASFEFCGINWGCSDGPKTAQFLSSFCASRNIVLSTDGEAGWAFSDFTAAIASRQALRVSSGADAADKKISAAILGLSGSSFLDTSFAGVAECAAMVTQMRDWTDKVFVLDYPPIGTRYLPYLTEVVNVDPAFWDNEWRPAYRAALQAAGGTIIYVYGDWQPTNLVLPNTAGYPDYHIDSPSCRRAAQRIFSYLLTAF